MQIVARFQRFYQKQQQQQQKWSSECGDDPSENRYGDVVKYCDEGVGDKNNLKDISTKHHYKDKILQSFSEKCQGRNWTDILNWCPKNVLIQKYNKEHINNIH